MPFARKIYIINGSRAKKSRMCCHRRQNGFGFYVKPKTYIIAAFQGVQIIEDCRTMTKINVSAFPFDLGAYHNRASRSLRGSLRNVLYPEPSLEPLNGVEDSSIRSLGVTKYSIHSIADSASVWVATTQKRKCQKKARLTTKMQKLRTFLRRSLQTHSIIVGSRVGFNHHLGR